MNAYLFCKRKRSLLRDSFFVYEPKLMMGRLTVIVSFETAKFRAEGGKILRISQSRNLGVMCLKNDI